ncbi:MAG: 16S rRNA (adenine(1518)-N(6)/adenine(1519)-N(6))-dimethyltransferase RsmA [Melioribacter sp.]|uniref:16S rRNA (adenine(1518)-N(6)/adenine(1519)-N(6))- dimethyltransferase RsmA n=1 Tax=Rosettibacter primus TaxID=3111523 RepID=UPI00247EAC9F|nr:16S rRNA (adenine(1518)-N(6)/adenine(1519)-N(6))-dimethyltransferase RsmA [Melioribacter sp.]
MGDKIYPLKRFGQNYLVDKNIVKKIIEEFKPEKEDVVLEIGPGTGALTAELVNKVKRFIAVEIDKRAVRQLKEKFPSLEIVNKDFLEVNLSEFVNKNKKLRIIGNIPYNITSPILFKLIYERKFVKDALLMVQYEVAKRITAKEGTKDYGILSVLLNYFAQTKLCFKISPNVFYPKPKVYSAIIQIIFNDEEQKEIDDDLFIKVVKAAFGNRRKVLKNSFSNSIFRTINFTNNESLTNLLTKRAEDLSIKDFVQLYEFIKSQL